MAASEATKRVHTKKSPPPMAAAVLLGPYLVYPFFADAFGNEAILCRCQVRNIRVPEDGRFIGCALESAGRWRNPSRRELIYFDGQQFAECRKKLLGRSAKVNHYSEEGGGRYPFPW